MDVTTGVSNILASRITGAHALPSSNRRPAMPENTIRVGLIGAGSNTTKLHIPGLKKQAGVEIVAVANRTRESGQRVASEFGIAKVHDDWPALIDDDGIDAVCIGTWTYMHSTLLIAALEAGEHVLAKRAWQWTTTMPATCSMQRGDIRRLRPRSCRRHTRSPAPCAVENVTAQLASRKLPSRAAAHWLTSTEPGADHYSDCSAV
jgi:hypothetical protein